MFSTSAASCPRIPSSRVTSSRRRRSDSLLMSRACSSAWASVGAGAGLGLGHDVRRLGLALPLGLVHELLGEQQGALEGVVGHARLGHGHGLRHRRLAALGLQLGDALRGLAHALVGLAHLLLEGLRLDGGLLQVLVDLVDVVPLQPEPELDRPQGLEDGLGRLGAVHGGRVYPPAPSRRPGLRAAVGPGGGRCAPLSSAAAGPR